MGLMAKSGDGGLQGTEKLQAGLEDSRNSGQSLDNNTRAEMEGKMGADLGDVKIHTDANAHQMSEGINAKAFTHGHDIYFKSGNYNPTSTEGKSLLAHELTHTLQQRGSAGRRVQRFESRAYEYGKSQKGSDKKSWENWDVYANDKLKTKNLYKAELLWPEAAPIIFENQKEPIWKVPSFNDLFSDSKMATALNGLANKTGKEVLERVKDLSSDEVGNNVHTGMKNVANLLIGDINKTKNTFQQIIDWTPGAQADTSGRTGVDRDENAYKYYSEAKALGHHTTLTIKQKQRLINDATPTPLAGDDEKLIMELLLITPATDLKKLFEGISYDNIYSGLNGDNKKNFKLHYEKYK